ncbi:MAG: flippase-like domain-containing protein [Anaerolineaceae bacterium]|nr:flippase-like domain-containing protein [Anaerolineaceae bacterium]
MKRWIFWLGVIISLVLLYFAFRNQEFNLVWAVIKEANYIWLLPGVAIYFVAVWARAWRWHYLLRPLKTIQTKKMFPIVTIGYMGNNIYPYRAGEVLRAYILRKREDIPMSASLATIVVERVFDGVVMLGFIFMNLPELARLTGDSGFIGNIQTLALWGAGIFLIVLMIFLLAAMFPSRIQIFTTWMINRVIPTKLRGKITNLTARFLEGLEALRSPREVAMVFLTSIVIWLLETGKYWFVMQAFTFKLSYFALMLMNGIVNLATTIPSAPGYVGTFDAPGIALLTAYHVPVEVATGYTLLLHAALWLPPTLLGAYFLIVREGMEWGKIPKMDEETRKHS